MVIGLVLLAAAAAGPAGFPDRAWQAYQTELSAQCPTRRLDLLAPADLRESLDTFRDSRRPALRREMKRAEAQRCADRDGGAQCSNAADVEVAARHAIMTPLVRQVCSDYSMCREQSDCDTSVAAAPGLDATLARAANGDVRALRKAAALRQHTDGAQSEAIDKSFSDALLHNPAAVLRLVHDNPGLPRLNWTCQPRAIEPTHAQADRYRHEAIVALGTVKAADLRPLRDECVADLRRQHGAAG